MKKIIVVGLVAFGLLVAVGCSNQSKTNSSSSSNTSTSKSTSQSSSSQSSSDEEITSGKTYDAVLSIVKSAYSSYDDFKAFYTDDVLSVLSEKGDSGDGSVLYFNYYKAVRDKKGLLENHGADVSLSYVEGSLTIKKIDYYSQEEDITPQYSFKFKANEDGTSTAGTRHDIITGYYYEDGKTDYEKLLIANFTSEEDIAEAKDD